MSQTNNIINFNTTFNKAKLYAIYNPERTSLGHLLNTLFEHYEIRETYIEDEKNFDCVVFYSIQKN